MNTPLTDEEIEAVRQRANRDTQYGRGSWQQRTARGLGLETNLNPRGRLRQET